MADHGECTILVPASDSPGRVADTELALYYSMGQSFSCLFVYVRGNIISNNS